MKKLLLLIAVSLVGVGAQAQIAKWVIKPTYDRIELVNGNLFKGYSKGSTTVWNKDGGEVATATKDVFVEAYRENMGVVVEKGSDKVYGVMDVAGNLVDLSAENYTVVYDYPYYSDGFLLVRNGGKYFFLDKNGNMNFGVFDRAYPMCDGVAVVATIDKAGELCWNYLFAEDGSMAFDAKTTPTFCASFSDNEAIVLVDKKIYTLTLNKQMTLLHADGNLSNKKSVVVADKESALNKDGDGFVYEAKNAKFAFDAMMRPKTVALAGGATREYDYPAVSFPFVDSDFEKYANHTGQFGLMYDEELLLPPQFEQIPVMVDDNAIVVKDGKFGIVSLDKNASIQFKLNDNEYIGFAHQNQVVKLAVSLPSFIKCSSAIVVSQSDFCQIQTETRIERENIEANMLGYDCKLTIDPKLSDTLKVRDYYFAIRYDGLQTIDYRVSVEEWFVKYYKVEMSQSEYSLQPKDSLQIEFDVLKSNVSNADVSYFKRVELVPDFMAGVPELFKVSESHYSFYLQDPGLDRLTFTIRIVENGCPPADYPYEVLFVRPEKKNQPISVMIKPIIKRGDKSGSNSTDVMKFNIVQ